MSLGGNPKFSTTCDARSACFSGLMFCVPVEEAHVQRSTVLQTLREAAGDGLSQLPDSITREAFFLWASSELRSQYVEARTWDELATIIKVADVLADTELDSWLAILSARVSEHDWKADSDSSLCTLLSLPQHLILALMRKLVPHRTENEDDEEEYECALSHTMECLPVPLHGSLLSSLIDTDGKLALRMATAGPLLAAGLNRSQLTGQPLLSLDLLFVADLGECTLLSNSIASHNSLTSLRLGLQKRLETHVLCKSLSDMHQLRSLHVIGVFGGPELTAFSAALWQMTAIASFTMRYIHVNTREVRPGSATELACHNFIQALATRPQLSHLVLNSNGITCPPHLLQGGFSSLQSLKLSVPAEAHQPHDFLVAMTQLTSLTVIQRHFRSLRQHPADETGGTCEHVCQEAAVLTSIKCLDLSCCPPTDTTAASSTEAIRHCLQRMPMLEKLSMVVHEDNPMEVDAPCPWPQIEWSVCCSSLTELCLTFENSNLTATPGEIGPTVLENVARMTDLLKLQVSMRVYHPCVCVLPIPPNLTSLELEGVYEELGVDCAVVGKTMAGLTSLQEVALILCRLDSLDSLSASLAHLTGLTHLQLQGGEQAFTDQSIESLCGALKHMHVLRTLDFLHSLTDSQAVMTLKSMSSLQSLSSVTLGLNSDVADGEVGGELKEAVRVMRKVVGMVKMCAFDTSTGYPTGEWKWKPLLL